MKRFLPLFRILFFLMILLSSCQLGPPYTPPTPRVPNEWKSPHYTTTQEPEFAHWWEIFRDPQLDRLEEQAIENNPNLYAALERFFAARAHAGVQQSNLWPQINLTPSYMNQGILFKLYGVPPNAFPGIKEILRIHQMQYTLPFNLSYELDLWGKLCGQYKSALYNAQAQFEAFNTVMLSLTADVAGNYYNLRTLDKQLVLLKDTLDLRSQTLKLTRSRFQHGLVPLLDITNAEQLFFNAEADYYDSLRQRNNIENAIATLLGLPASEFSIEPNPLEGAPPEVPPGIPSDVLYQRPDIAEAERKMASEHQLIGVAYASFFPSLTLTGTLGWSSPDFKNFLKNFSRWWLIGADISQFIFDAGKRVSDAQKAWADYCEAVFNYQQTILTAFQEVEDALNNLELQAKQAGSLKASSDAASKAAGLSMDRYKRGVINFLEVIDSQRTELEVQSAYIAVQGQRYQSAINLIKALGGIWHADAESIPDPCERTTPLLSE